MAMNVEITKGQYDVLREIVSAYEIAQLLEGQEAYNAEVKRRESFKNGDYITYIGGSTSKYLTIGQRYRLTCSPYQNSRRVSIINDAGKRMNLRSYYFDF